jgi:DNA-directed RNA polymerase specialized sigma24 family protein
MGLPRSQHPVVLHGLEVGKPEHATEREWTAFTLRYRNRLTLKAIGERLGITPPRVAQLLYKVEYRCERRLARGGHDGTAP